MLPTMKIGIIGAGKIGLAMGELAEKFANVVYLDKKEPYPNDYSLLNDTDLNFISVNTANLNGYEMDNIKDCLAKTKNLKNVVILSTCPPSFFESENNYIYSPLFIRQGTVKEDIINAEFVLIGHDKISPQPLIDFYTKIRPDYNYIKVSCKEAATIKMGINGFLTLKIAYANMIGDYCVENKMNQEAVLKAISDFRPVNPYYFKYGYGFGGPCLPIDNNALASELDKKLPIQIDEENKAHLEFQFNEFVKNKDKELEHTFENVSYKRGVPIIVHSQKLALAEKLARNGFKIKIKDTAEICDLVEIEYPHLFSFEKI